MGGVIPRARPSVREISTWASFRSGPSTATFSIFPFGPSTVTRSLARYCPGWDSGRLGLRLWPKRVIACSFVTWTCLPEASRGTKILPMITRARASKSALFIIAPYSCSFFVSHRATATALMPPASLPMITAGKISGANPAV